MALTRVQKLITVEDVDGKLIPAAGAVVDVQVQSSGLLDLIYTDRDGTTPKANPITLDDDGMLEFYCYPKVLKLVATHASGTTTYPDFLGVDEKIIKGPQGAPQFSDVAAMKAATPLNSRPIAWADYLGRKVSTVVHNTTSSSGAADYVIVNVNPGNLSTLVGGILVGVNHDLGGGYYAKQIFGARVPFSACGGGAGVSAAVNTAVLNKMQEDYQAIDIDAAGFTFESLTILDGVSVLSDAVGVITVETSAVMGEEESSVSGFEFLTPRIAWKFNTTSGDSVKLGKKAIFEVFSLSGAVEAIDGVGALSNGIHCSLGDFPEIKVNWKISGFISAVKITGGAIGSGLTINRAEIFVKWVASCQNALEKVGTNSSTQINTSFYIEKCAVGYKGAGSLGGFHQWRFDDVGVWIENTGTGVNVTRLDTVKLMGHTATDLSTKINNTDITSTVFICRDSIVTCRGYDSVYSPNITSLPSTHNIIGRNVELRLVESDAASLYGKKSSNDVSHGVTLTFGSPSFGSFVVERANRTKLYELDITGTAWHRSGASFGNQNALTSNDVTIINDGDFINNEPGNGLILKTPNGAASYKITVDNSGNVISTIMP